jgi:hypothetical protein
MITTFNERTVPTIHLNGTASETLVDQLIAAIESLRIARSGVSECQPNPRDFIGRDGDYQSALSAHFKRIESLDEIMGQYSRLVDLILENRQRKCNAPACTSSYNSCCEISHQDWTPCENCGGHCCPAHKFRYSGYTLCWNCHGEEAIKLAMIKVNVSRLVDIALRSPHVSADDVLSNVMAAISNGTIYKGGGQ